MDAPAMKYNPAFLTEQELVDSFVVRHVDLSLCMQVVRENTGDSNQHLLVVGPRGIGKTTLLLRAVAEVRRTPELDAQWHPIVFAEESYQVASAGEFWLEALFHLAHQTGSNRWRQVHEELQTESDDVRLRERALAQLMDFADSQNKRLLLVVENLHMLLGEQVSDDDAWELRHTFLNEPRIMVLASATQSFDEVQNTGKALFGLFKTFFLRPLDTTECASLWGATTGQTITEGRIRPIEILTGGNPRLLRMIAQFGRREPLRTLMTDLMRLVDEHTEYFKNHLDKLPAAERKTYLTLAELWAPATAKEVAVAARLDVNKTSAFLNRLVDRGAVVVADQRGRRKSYQLAERMYNIYYLMRRRGGPSSRLRAAVDFMVEMYSHSEFASPTEEPTRHAMARELAAQYLSERSLDRGHLHKTLEAIIGLASAINSNEALQLLNQSTHFGAFEPLRVALLLDLGEEITAPVEIAEVANDIVKQIEERRKCVTSPAPADQKLTGLDCQY